MPALPAGDRWSSPCLLTSRPTLHRLHASSLCLLFPWPACGASSSLGQFDRCCHASGRRSGAIAQAEHPDASFILASAAEMHGRLRQWPEARGLAARAADLAPADASPLQARVVDKHAWPLCCSDIGPCCALSSSVCKSRSLIRESAPKTHCCTAERDPATLISSCA